MLRRLAWVASTTTPKETVTSGGNLSLRLSKPGWCLPTTPTATSPIATWSTLGSSPKSLSWRPLMTCATPPSSTAVTTPLPSRAQQREPSPAMELVHDCATTLVLTSARNATVTLHSTSQETPMSWPTTPHVSSISLTPNFLLTSNSIIRSRDHGRCSTCRPSSIHGYTRHCSPPRQPRLY